jgi:hypothetical protein
VARELTPAEHAFIRRQLALIPVYIWVVYSWTHLLVNIPKDTPVRDFSHFYTQGVIALRHDAAALYDMDRMAHVLEGVVPGARNVRYPPVYGPQVSVFFSAFARLPYRAARDAWVVISVLVYGMCVAAVWRISPRLRDRPVLIALLAAASPGLHYMLGFVQVSALGLVCVTVAYLAFRAGRPFLAGLALGTLSYKPPLAIAVGFVMLFAAEWRAVGGAIVAALAEVGVGVWYWGTSIVRPYIAALLRLPDVTSGMEPHKYHMHSLRAFFELLGLSGSAAMAAYVVAAAATCVLALICWKRRGPLAVRFSVVVIATILVDPHLYAYDLVLLTPVFLLLWNWILAEPVRPLDRVAPWIARWAPGRSFTDAIVALIYFCYFAPLLATFADLGHVQVSVIAMVLLALLAGMGAAFRVDPSTRNPDHEPITSTPPDARDSTRASASARL